MLVSWSGHRMRMFFSARGKLRLSLSRASSRCGTRRGLDGSAWRPTSEIRLSSLCLPPSRLLWWHPQPNVQLREQPACRILTDQKEDHVSSQQPKTELAGV